MNTLAMVLCFDGTGLSAHDYPDTEDPLRKNPFSSVAKIAKSILTGPIETQSYIQVCKYYSGIGSSEPFFIFRTLKAIGGFGAVNILLNALVDIADTRQCHPSMPLELHMTGFSRGAMIALVLEKFIHTVGIPDWSKIMARTGTDITTRNDKLAFVSKAYHEMYVHRKKPSTQDIESFRFLFSCPDLPATHLHVFDPVAAFYKGREHAPFNAFKDEIPNQDAILLHGPRLSPIVESCTVFIAKDEMRATYPLFIPQASELDIDVRLFEGDHSCIGGGSRSREAYSDYIAGEMIFHMNSTGVIFDDKILSRLFHPDMHAYLDNRPNSSADLPHTLTCLHARATGKYRPRILNDPAYVKDPSIACREDTRRRRDKKVNLGQFLLTCQPHAILPRIKIQQQPQA